MNNSSESKVKIQKTELTTGLFPIIAAATSTMPRLHPHSQ